MKHYRNRLWSLLLAATMAFSALSWMPQALLGEPVYAQTMPTTSRDDAPEAVKKAASRLINAFGNQEQTAVDQSLAKIKEASPDEWGPVYENILNFWTWAENEMVENIDAAPDGIANPESHCFIVLGYALNDDGTMRDELVGRLNVALNSLKKYPQARVLVTGGVMKNGWTEGKRMHDWLVENGIDESRIYVESQAPDTAGNATYSFDILYKAGDVRTVSLISSQYHLRRGSVLYYTESLLKAKEMGVEPIEFLGTMNAGWLREDKTSEPLSTKANSMYSICRVPKLSTPDLSNTTLTGLDVIFPEGNKVVQGSEPNWSIKTLDTKNDNLTVTEYCTFSGLDTNKIGKQTVTVTYTYKQTTVSAQAEIEVVYPDYKQGLAKLADQGNALVQDKYSPATWKAMKPALENANALLADLNASADACQKAQASLQSGLDGLVKANPMNRLYNPNSGEHFYTADGKERDFLVSLGWKFEGQDWIAPEKSDIPVYRLYNPNAGDHHYTLDKVERDALIKLGWNDEGIGWYCAGKGGIPLYRQYNPNAKAGSHNYTPSKHENDVLVSLGWKAEGIAWYACNE